MDNHPTTIITPLIESVTAIMDKHAAKDATELPNEVDRIFVKYLQECILEFSACLKAYDDANNADNKQLDLPLS